MLVVPRLACPSWRWMTFSETPSRASSTAWAWRSWWGAKRRLTPASAAWRRNSLRSEEHTSELQSRENLVCRLLLEKKKTAGRETLTKDVCDNREALELR